MSVLSTERVSVASENDVVVLQVGRAQARFSYATASTIAQAMRVAANQAALTAKIPYAERQELRRFLPAEAEELSLPALGEQRRTTDSASKGLRWSVGVNGQLVVFDLGNVHMEFESDTAFTVAQWMRIRAREAKRWAGDPGHTLRISGSLSDAELNYRHGLR